MSNVTDLPDIQFCETDTAEVEKNILTVYEGVTKTPLYDGDPVRLFLSSLAAIITQQRTLINNTGLQNLLYYAKGSVLDYLGAFYNVYRLPASHAVTTTQFSLPEALAFALPIQEGTRVSADSQLFFETVNPVEIAAGALTVNVPVICQTVGEIGNGYAAGQINQLVDQIGYGLTVENIDPTSGGAEIENDDRFKARIQETPESFSVAGPTGAYRHYAKSVRQDIVDVAVYRKTPLETHDTATLDAVLSALGQPVTGTDEQKKQAIAEYLSPSTVHISPLLENGQLPDTALLDQVLAAVNNRDVRPLTDHVIVSAPIHHLYDLDLEFFINSDDELRAVEIQAAVSKAINEFISWQHSKMGRSVNPSKLHEMIMAAGAARVVINQPEFTPLAENAVALADNRNIIYGGLIDGV